MSRSNTVALIIGIVGILMIGLGLGYIWGTYRVNKCMTMTVTDAYQDRECREFFLRR